MSVFGHNANMDTQASMADYFPAGRHLEYYANHPWLADIHKNRTPTNNQTYEDRPLYFFLIWAFWPDNTGGSFQWEQFVIWRCVYSSRGEGLLLSL